MAPTETLPEAAPDPATALPQPDAACSYRRNPDGSLTALDAPTIVPDFAPKE